MSWVSGSGGVAGENEGAATCYSDMPRTELPELPGFTLELRVQMQNIQRYRKPALTIDNAGWQGLGQILARHQRDMDEAAAIDRVVAALPGKTRRAVDKSVLRPLKKAQVGLKSVMVTASIRDRVERVSGNRSVTGLLDEAIRLIEEAVREEDRAVSAFVADATGRLEEDLRAWWGARSRARSGGGRGETGGRSGQPAYHQFLELCFGVLSSRPGSAYDALREHRGRRAQNEQAWKQIADQLRKKLRQNR